MNGTEVIVLGVGRYSFTDEKSGRLLEGTTVHFIEQGKISSENQEGFVPRKATLDIKEYENIRKLEFPYICKPLIQQTYGSKGVIAKIVAFEPVGKAKL